MFGEMDRINRIFPLSCHPVNPVESSATCIAKVVTFLLQFLKQYLRLLQVCCIKSLGKPAVNLGQHLLGLLLPTRLTGRVMSNTIPGSYLPAPFGQRFEEFGNRPSQIQRLAPGFGCFDDLWRESGCGGSNVLSDNILKPA
jgi:hypothetical protein